MNYYTHENYEMSSDDIRLIAEKILKDCFWGDYSFEIEDVLTIIQSGSMKEKKFLFSKIIQNGRHVSYLLRIFKKEDLEMLFESYKITFNKERMEKRINLSKAILLHKYNNDILENYKWSR